MGNVHNGVLIPAEMENASVEELDIYAANVKLGNRRFIDAYFALEDQAQALGLKLDS